MKKNAKKQLKRLRKNVTYILQDIVKIESKENQQRLLQNIIIVLVVKVKKNIICVIMIIKNVKKQLI